MYAGQVAPVNPRKDGDDDDAEFWANWVAGRVDWDNKPITHTGTYRRPATRRWSYDDMWPTQKSVLADIEKALTPSTKIKA